MRFVDELLGKQNTAGLGDGAAISLENENLRAHEQYADPTV
jgi:hypothetical protein